MARKQPDRERLQKIEAGEHDAWRQLVAQYTPLLFVLVYAQVKQVEEAQDIVQNAFLRSSLRYPKLRP